MGNLARKRHSSFKYLLKKGNRLTQGHIENIWSKEQANQSIIEILANDI
jgi:hypothetical protein